MQDYFPHSQYSCYHLPCRLMFFLLALRRLNIKFIFRPLQQKVWNILLFKFSLYFLFSRGNHLLKVQQTFIPEETVLSAAGCRYWRHDSVIHLTWIEKDIFSLKNQHIVIAFLKYSYHVPKIMVMWFWKRLIGFSYEDSIIFSHVKYFV